MLFSYISIFGGVLSFFGTLELIKVIENIFISPFQHQLHHSTKYYNKNYGGYLAVWDNIFGTLQKSKKIVESKEKIRFGVEIKDFQTVSNLLFVPFRKIYTKTRR